MDGAIQSIINAIVNGGPEALAGLGWIFFLIERYYIAHKKEQQFREDLSSMQNSYQELGSKLTDAMQKFHVVLEVIKDRMR